MFCEYFISVITSLRVGPLCNLSIPFRGRRCLSSPYRLYWLWVSILSSRHRGFLLGSKRPGSEPDNSAFVFYMSWVLLMAEVFLDFSWSADGFARKVPQNCQAQRRSFKLIMSLNCP
jgi:hypothetical protein